MIRALFAAQPDARRKSFTAGSFSFNVPGGRCDVCEGDGTVTVEMQFLADIELPCEECNGTRYKATILDIKYKNKNIYDVLNMTVKEALVYFAGHPKIVDKLYVLDEVGLGYVRLGQSATTLSGGEAQRVKLASHLATARSITNRATSNEIAAKARSRTLYILDEPTTGLHFDDVAKLLAAFRKLIDGGGSLLVIEHNLDVIKSADWVDRHGSGGRGCAAARSLRRGHAGGDRGEPGEPYRALARAGAGRVSKSNVRFRRESEPVMTAFRVLVVLAALTLSARAQEAGTTTPLDERYVEASAALDAHDYEQRAEAADAARGGKSERRPKILYDLGAAQDALGPGGGGAELSRGHRGRCEVPRSACGAGAAAGARWDISKMRARSSKRSKTIASSEDQLLRPGLSCAGPHRREGASGGCARRAAGGAEADRPRRRSRYAAGRGTGRVRGRGRRGSRGGISPRPGCALRTMPRRLPNWLASAGKGAACG